MQFVNYTPSHPEPKTALKFPHQFARTLAPTASLPPKPHVLHCAHPSLSLPARPGSLSLPAPARSSSAPQAFPALPAPSASHPVPVRPPSGIPKDLPPKNSEWSRGAGPKDPLNDFDVAFIENGIVSTLESKADSPVDLTPGTASTTADDDASGHRSQHPSCEGGCEHQGSLSPISLPQSTHAHRRLGTIKRNKGQGKPQVVQTSQTPAPSPSPLSDPGAGEAGDASTAVGAETETSTLPRTPACSSGENATSPESVSALHSPRAAGGEKPCRTPVLRPGSPFKVMEAVVIRTASDHGRQSPETSACNLDGRHVRASWRSTQARKTLRHQARKIPRGAMRAVANRARKEQTHFTDDPSRDRDRRRNAHRVKSTRRPSPSDISDTVSGSDDDYNPSHLENRPSKRRSLCMLSGNTASHHRQQAPPPAPNEAPSPISLPVDGQTSGQQRLSPEDISAVVSAMTEKLLEILRGSSNAAPAVADQQAAAARKNARWSRNDDERLERLRTRGWHWWEIKQQFPHRTLAALQQRCVKLQVMRDSVNQHPE
ncbi:hypothetical protein ACJ73_02616 [Blastomyces percursus]|uniref:Myb-like domain-containing protein n=1 Tax=Blastomyces percursus TaxID=1658174 RepID=A0A1J9QBW1_9EURO|nr:hypothetical protein ACJ73_02616 [Blastomyces percursus]